MDWVSVKDKMPDYGEFVIVVIEHLDPPIFFHLMEWRDRWICLTDGEDLDKSLKVNYWAYVPEPPEK